MALIQCQFNSEVLGINTSMTVILPQETINQIGMKGKAFAGKHPTLFLLHGFSDDDTIWSRRTSLERYAASLGIAVVMPNAHKSFYTDMEYGDPYWTFLTEELPQVARSFFPLSDDPKLNFVAGLSMGGYGAFKWALTHPDRFAAAASLSGVLDIAALKANPSNPAIGRAFDLIFGERAVTGSPDDLFELLGRLPRGSAELPELYQCCGTEDFLYEDNIRFRDAIRKAGYPNYRYEEGPGDHEWGYWDAHIQEALALFGRKAKERMASMEG
ncbi:alpha/beta hydrolase family protein [Cohnella sp. AR92]|uniref:alpha/beta hydrolase n=1 Tax=Cohnella sp. AR92 TaxID=648716 RepID=UPI000F8D5B39|nr:alpha/beta hydrolase family protein [Cohnella sp. AR92]RUS47957.1 esterase family protein [Cohnella sp. AR92]